MKIAPWLISPRFDLAVFLGPTLAAMALVLLRAPLAPEGELPLPGWVVAVLLVDVAHVWATLPRTYLDPEARQAWPRLLIAVPVLGLVTGIVLHTIGARWFWTGLAYAAVWHFIRQQVGWVSLYQRRAGELRDGWARLDHAAIYVATGAPLLFWHLGPARRFEWFVPGDFLLPGPRPWLAWSIVVVAALGLGGYALISVVRARSAGQWPLGKWLIVLTTALCWSVGIVFTNDDWSFTWTNVLVHGVPYLGFVWVSSGAARQGAVVPWWWRSALGFLALVVGLAFAEELAWDRLIWHDHGAIFPGPNVELGRALKSVLVPLLALPQLTHYLLDAWIWRTRDPRNAALQALTAPG